MKRRKFLTITTGAVGGALACGEVGAARPRAHDPTEFYGVLVDTSVPVSIFGSWRGGSLPFVIPDGATLSIDPGVRLALDGAAVVQLGLGARISVEGELSVVSNSLLTSLFDDEAAGDTNRDGSATAPSKGDWNGIDVQTGGLVSFTSTELRHATDGLRVLSGGGVVMVDSEIHQTTGRGLALGTHHADGCSNCAAGERQHHNHRR